MFNLITLNHFLLVAGFACNTFYFNLPHNHITYFKFYTQTKKTFTNFYALFPLQKSSFDLGRSAT